MWWMVKHVFPAPFFSLTEELFSYLSYHAIYFSHYRLKMKFSCMMELNKYPLDVQVCTMEVASCKNLLFSLRYDFWWWLFFSVSKTTRELILEWNQRSPVDLSSDLKMPQFTVESVVTDKCEESSLIGNYSCLVARFHLSRSIGFHMVQSYIPTILIVVISWVSFWMDVDSVPGRTTLGVTTLLTVSSKSAGKSILMNHFYQSKEAPISPRP